MERNEVNPVEFGRVIGHLESIEKKMDELSGQVNGRVSELEKRVDALEIENAKRTVPNQYLDKLMWAALAGTAAVAAKTAGLF